jgi:hypothetical protein
MKLRIRPFRRQRTPIERVVAAAGDAADIRPSRAVKTGAGAVVATTAASAAISALRRRKEEPRR